jgi:hypothetical protein
MSHRLMTVLFLAAACGRTPMYIGPCTRDAYATTLMAYDPTFGGSEAPTLEQFTDPYVALGPPDYTGGGRGFGAVSLGYGGLLEVGFGGCLASNDGGAGPDIRVHEVGPNIERTLVSLVATEWTAAQLEEDEVPASDREFFVGVLEGSIRELDIDGAFRGYVERELSFVSIVLVDDPSQGWTDGERPGADIDAIELLSAAEPVE